MRPLKESADATSPIEAEAIELLRSAPGHEPPAGQKQRVRARLLQQRVTHRAIVFRPVVVVSVVLCAAAASAAVGRHFIAEVVNSLVSPHARRPAAKTTASSAAPRARAAGGIAVPGADSAAGAPGTEAVLGAAPVAEMPAAGANDNRIGTSPAPVSSAVPDRSPPTRRPFARGKGKGKGSNSAATRKSIAAPKSVPVTRSTDTPGSSPPVADEATPPSPVAAVAPADLTRKSTRAARPAEDTGLVFDAMRALRQEGQPTRASGLLDEYMRRHPRGALAEEALALSVEAAMVRRDPRARALVAEYTARFPNGHFRAAVESARRRLAP